MIRIPRLFVAVRAMKAGTSLLYELLRDHPRIETVPIKEVNYFPHIYTDYYNITHGLRLHHLKIYSASCEVGRSVGRIQEDIAFFSQYLLDPVDDRWFKNLFKSGSRTYKAEFSNIMSILEPDALRHIRRIARHAKIIYVIRDPLARLWSHTKFHNSFDWRDGKTFDLSDLSSSQFEALFQQLGHHRHGEYTDNIRRLKMVFGTRELHIVFYEDLISAGQRTIDAICDFIGISRHTPPAERFATRVNAGPTFAMPHAFLEAARPYIRREFDGLPAVGVQPHASWRSI